MHQNLNESQQKAVTHRKGPLLIIAGAGSGKTRVVTSRIAKLINEDGVAPHSILALTFTNKAASEMKERVESLLGNRSLDIWISTFHSACVRILRRDIERLGYSKDFVIYDTNDQTDLIKQCLKDVNSGDDDWSPKTIASKISLLKNNLQDASSDSYIYENDKYGAIVQELYPIYQKKLKANNALDFDDLLLKTVQLLKLNPDILDYYQTRFQYISVDEYQDTNSAQYQLVYLLAKKHQNICVVGDEDQSIYRWRGANINNILNFEKNFKNARVIKLEENYRSTKNILEASNHVICKNIQRKGKILFTNNQEGEKIVYYRAISETDEGDFISKTVLGFLQEGKIRFDDVAVFYRTNAQSRVIEDSLRKSNIPYQIIGGLKFYARKEIKDIIAYCRFIINPDDSVSFNRIISTNIHGIGKVTLEKIHRFSSENNLSPYRAIGEMAKSETLPGAAKTKINNFFRLINRLIEFSQKNNVSEVIKYIQTETGYIEKLMKKSSFEASNKIENLKELVTSAKSFEENSSETGLNDFLDQVALVSDIDGFDDKHGTVALMTLHNSKGLEFPVVFMIGMEEKILPHIGSLYDVEEMEEERRLCYVGMTRAKKRLFLLNAVTRRIYGEEQSNSPSQFIDDIPHKFLELVSPPEQDMEAYGNHPAGNQNRGGNYNFSSSFRGGNRRNFSYLQKKSRLKKESSSIKPGKNHGKSDKFPIGKKVTHPSFGDGVILNKDGNDDNETLSIFFKGVGKKKIKSQYVTLKAASGRNQKGYRPVV